MDYINTPAERYGYIDVKGGKIWYRINGLKHTDKPPVLVVHGGPGSSHNYLLPALRLIEDRTVILYDQLDCGNSDKPDDPENWHLERFTDEMETITQVLGLKEFHILANSWGPAIALNFAARKPAGLKSMVLCGALVNTQRWVADNELYRQQLPDDVRNTMLKYEATEDYEHPDYQKAVSFYYHRHLCRLETWPECVLATMKQSNSSLYQYMWGPTEFLSTGTLKDLDLTPLLPNIHTPTLFISGEYDEGTPAATKEFSKMMPNGRAVMIPDASHMPHVESPDVHFGHVRSFLNEHD